MRYAILIDAGFLKHKLGSRSRPFSAENVLAFLDSVRAHRALAGMRLHRVYWYDAPPLSDKVSKPLRGGQINFAATALARANLELLAELCELPYFSVRRGYLVFRGWKARRGRLPENESSVMLTAADVEPSVHQKGVDMRLGLDIAALTLKAHVRAIVLVAGDSDFVPAMKFARREGAQIILVTLGHRVRSDMLEHSDLLLGIPASCSGPALTIAANTSVASGMAVPA